MRLSKKMLGILTDGLKTFRLENHDVEDVLAHFQQDFPKKPKLSYQKRIDYLKGYLIVEVDIENKRVKVKVNPIESANVGYPKNP